MKMSFLAVDDEKLVLTRLLRILEQVVPGCDARGFTLPREALFEVAANGFRPNVAFLDVEMPGMTGLELAKQIREKSPRTKIIFATGYSQYALEAYSVHARGYVMKPVTAEKVRAELLELAEETARPQGRVMVRCFGNFDVFVDGVSLQFSRSKAKELFAYLIHKKGTACTVRELAAVLFEDQEYNIQTQNYLQKIITSMMRAFSSVEMEDIVNKHYNSLSVNTTAVDCDFYRFSQMDAAAVNSYMGEYMAQYSWAEFTLGYLDNIIG